MIKFKDLIEGADSLYDEPAKIKKRLGGRYGGEPKKAIADPGNLPEDFAVDTLKEGVSPKDLIRGIEAEIEKGQAEGWNAHKIVSVALNNLKNDPDHYKQQPQHQQPQQEPQQEFSARPGGGTTTDATTQGGVTSAASKVLIPKPVMEKIIKGLKKLKELTDNGNGDDIAAANDDVQVRHDIANKTRPPEAASSKMVTPKMMGEIGHKHKKWEPGQPFPKEVAQLIKQYTSNDKTAIKELSPRGTEHGLKFNKPKDGIWAYVWRLAKFRSGVDPRTPMRADWDLSDEIEKKTGWRVNFYANDDPAQKAVMKALDGQVTRVVKALGLNPKGASIHRDRTLGSFSGDEPDAPPEEKPQEKSPERPPQEKPPEEKEKKEKKERHD